MKRESAEVASATFLWPRNGWVCSVPNLIKGHIAEKSARTLIVTVMNELKF